MNLSASLLIGLLVGGLFSVHTRADERRFSYTYEPETTPAGAMELENWVTLRAGRGESVGQKNFNQWDLRQEIEYGVTDRYTLVFTSTSRPRAIASRAVRIIRNSIGKAFRSRTATICSTRPSMRLA